MLGIQHEWVIRLKPLTQETIHSMVNQDNVRSTVPDFLSHSCALLTFTESMGNMTQCSAMPASAPAKHVTDSEAVAGSAS